MARRPLILTTLALVVTALAACEVPVEVPVGTTSTPASAAPSADTRIVGSAYNFPRGGEAVVPSPAASYGPVTIGMLEAALAGAEVVLMDAGGNAIAGLPAIKTDNGGRFELLDLPRGYTFVVEVRPADGSRPLRSLVSTTAGGETVKVSPATTIATAMLMTDLKDVPPAHDAKAFARLTHEISLYTTPTEFDLYTEDRQLAAKVGAIAAGSAAVWEMLVTLKRDLSGKATPVADVFKGGVSASPAPTARPSGATAAPTVTPTAAVITPNPSPTPTRSPSPTATPSAGTVDTVAGDGTAGFSNAVNASARFRLPRAVAADPTGVLYVVDEPNHAIRRVSGSNTTTLAGNATSGDEDASGDNASFNNPSGIDYDKDSGKLYVADFANRKVRIVDPDGTVTTLQSPAGVDLVFADPVDVAIGPSALFVLELNQNRVQRVAFDTNGRGTVTLAAGSSSGLAGFVDAVGASARFDHPRGLAVDGDGNVIVADTGNHRIRKLTHNAANTEFAVTTLAGDGTRGDTNGSSLSGRLSDPSGVSVAPDGSIYIADSANNMIRKLASQQLTTVAGLSVPGFQNGAVGSARFNRPRDVLAFTNKKIYVVDTNNNRIRLITLP